MFCLILSSESQEMVQLHKEDGKEELLQGILKKNLTSKKLKGYSIKRSIDWKTTTSADSHEKEKDSDDTEKVADGPVDDPMINTQYSAFFKKINFGLIARIQS